MQPAGTEIQENVPLAPLTTLGVGGKARYFVRATSARMVEQAIGFAQSNEIPLFVLGGGSNLVVSDRGWKRWYEGWIRGLGTAEHDGKIVRRGRGS